MQQLYGNTVSEIFVLNTVDKEDPGKGITVKMLAGSSNPNCSLSVSVICQKNKVDVRICIIRRFFDFDQFLVPNK